LPKLKAGKLPVLYGTHNLRNNNRRKLLRPRRNNGITRSNPRTFKSEIFKEEIKEEPDENSEGETFAETSSEQVNPIRRISTGFYKEGSFDVLEQSLQQENGTKSITRELMNNNSANNPKWEKYLQTKLLKRIMQRSRLRHLQSLKSFKLEPPKLSIIQKTHAASMDFAFEEFIQYRFVAKCIDDYYILNDRALGIAADTHSQDVLKECITKNSKEMILTSYGDNCLGNTSISVGILNHGEINLLSTGTCSFLYLSNKTGQYHIKARSHAAINKEDVSNNKNSEEGKKSEEVVNACNKNSLVKYNCTILDGDIIILTSQHILDNLLDEEVEEIVEEYVGNTFQIKYIQVLIFLCV